jgi:alanine racemase
VWVRIRFLWEKAVRSWTEISLQALETNIQTIKKAVAPACLYGVIKADAYGHGMLEMAALLAKNKVDTFCVAALSEAIELRAAGYVNETIIFLTSFYPEEIPEFVQHRITPMIGDFEHLNLLSRYCKRKGIVMDAHLKLDIGMSRFGFLPDEIVQYAQDIFHAPGVRVRALCSHLASSGRPGDEDTLAELALFRQFCDYLELNTIWFGEKHILNSGGILYYRDMALDAVRPGLILYGYYPGEIDRKALKLAPAHSFFTRVQAVKTVKAGASIGYERSYRAKTDMTVALLSVGYADGYPVRFSNKGQIMIGRERCAVVGRVCMDTTMAAVSSGRRVRVGDTVRLWGGKDLPLEDAAVCAGTIPYELTCQITKRVVRTHVK